MRCHLEQYFKENLQHFRPILKKKNYLKPITSLCTLRNQKTKIVENPKVCIRKEKKNINIRVEINEIENRKTTEKINEIKSWFIEKINKVDKLLYRLIFLYRKKTHITNVRTERGDIITSGILEVRWKKCVKVGRNDQLLCHMLMIGQEICHWQNSIVTPIRPVLGVVWTETRVNQVQNRMRKE